MRKKIGIIAQYLNSRNDIREIISLLAEDNEICLYLRKEDYTNAIDGIEVREIHKEKRSFKNLFLQRFFVLFGILPKSKQNYYITEAFKTANTKTHWLFKTERKLLLFLGRFLPRWLSYDRYLNWLDYSLKTRIDDIDLFVCFSEIYDDALLSQLLQAHKKVIVYVYSWDHPCKMMRFSKRVTQYLVWNEGLKEDLISLQAIDAAKIVVLGSTQLAYIAEFKELPETAPKPYEFDYIYFGCATGTLELVAQEVAMIQDIAQMMLTRYPSLKLVVRPYPFLLAWKLYQPLKELSNIVFDDGYRTTESFALSRGAIYDKFTKIRAAKAFLHLGTTLGFEATYFNTPVFQIDFPVESTHHLNIKGFIHQYQNDKYLFLRQFPNVVSNVSELEKKIGDLLKQPTEFLQYNAFIAKQTPLKSFERLKDQMNMILFPQSKEVAKA